MDVYYIWPTYGVLCWQMCLKLRKCATPLGYPKVFARIPLPKLTLKEMSQKSSKTIATGEQGPTVKY